MLANLTELIAGVRSLINETGTTSGFWTDEEITEWLNEGQEVFGTFAKCLSKYYEHELELGNIKNDREIRLGHDGDFLAFDEGGVLYNDKPLTQTSLKALDEWVGSWRDSTGTPTRFYVRGDMIGFYPKPSVGDTVKYYGIERATTLANDVVPFSGDYRVVAFRRHIRDYAISLCWEKKNEITKADRKMRSFEKGLYTANAILNGEKNQPKMIIPAYRPRGHSYAIHYGRTDRFD